MTIKSSQLRIPGKNPVLVATTSNVSLSGGAPQTVDDVGLAVGDRILVWKQTSAAENGIYKVQTLGTGSNGTWVRTKDADLAEQDQFFAGVNVYVQEGSKYAKCIFYLVTTGAITLGSTDLTFISTGPIMRSDTSEQALANMGTSGAPVTLSTTYRTQTTATELIDYSHATWFVYVTNKSLATAITVKVEWSADNSTFGSQRSEVISGGASTASEYEVTFDISGLTSTFVLPVSLRVAAPYARLSVKCDVVAPTIYATVWRQV